MVQLFQDVCRLPMVIVKLTNSVLSHTEVLSWVIGTLKNVKGCISIGKGCNGHVIATGCSYCRIYEKSRISLQWLTSKGIFTCTVSCFSTRNSIVNTSVWLRTLFVSFTITNSSSLLMKIFSVVRV